MKILRLLACLALPASFLAGRMTTPEPLPPAAGLELDRVVLTEHGASRSGKVMTIRRDERDGPVYYGRGESDYGSDRMQLHGTFRGERVAIYLQLDEE